MRAIICDGFGDSNILKIKNVAQPQLKPNQLLVKVKAAGLNRADILQREGKYPAPAGESDILGLEIAGVVEEVHDKNNEFWLGKSVMGLVGGGGYAQYCAVDAGCVIPIPDRWDFITAAAVPEAFLTAYAVLFELGQLQENESVLIHAGASGVGTAAVQMAVYSKATVYFTAGSEKKIDTILKLGAKAGILYKTDDFAEQIKKFTNHAGVDLIIDFIGAAYLEKNLSSLKTSGRLILTALLGGSKTQINLIPILQKRLQLKGMNLRNRSIDAKRKLVQDFSAAWLQKLANHKIMPIIDETFDFTDVKKAHDKMEANLNTGKIILTHL